MVQALQARGEASSKVTFAAGMAMRRRWTNFFWSPPEDLGFLSLSDA